MKGNYKKQDSNTTFLTEILGSENQVSNDPPRPSSLPHVVLNAPSCLLQNRGRNRFAMDRSVRRTQKDTHHTDHIQCTN